MVSFKDLRHGIKKYGRKEEQALSRKPRQGWEESFVPHRVCHWVCVKGGDTALFHKPLAHQYDTIFVDRRPVHPTHKASL
jgi:hypothetical protein